MHSRFFRITLALTSDTADMIYLGIFGVTAMRSIKKDCAKRQIARQELEQGFKEKAVNMRIAIVKAGLDGCEDLSVETRPSRRHI